MRDTGASHSKSPYLDAGLLIGSEFVLGVEEEDEGGRQQRGLLQEASDPGCDCAVLELRMIDGGGKGGVRSLPDTLDRGV